ncbi:hypothetical protein SDC9_158133 [bioreactor metagenome]|uniref:Uncharacterized protein n=1 Tax=bioreactor metagenome TaxID=1076179 RepID=A0A645FB43_9ZZZZ
MYAGFRFYSQQFFYTGHNDVVRTRASGERPLCVLNLFGPVHTDQHIDIILLEKLNHFLIQQGRVGRDVKADSLV